MHVSEEWKRKNRENGKLGGRPKGVLNPRTLDKMKMKAALDQRYLHASRALANAQIHIATGQTFLYKIEKEWIKTGTNKKTGEENGYFRNKRPVLVTNQEEIESYLDSLVDEMNGEPKEYDEGATYFYMTAKEPNNEAIKNIMDRVHGTPKATVEHTGEVVFSLKDLAQRREALKVQAKIIQVPQIPSHED